MLIKIYSPSPGCYLSYGQITGNFEANTTIIQKISLDNNLNSLYAFVEFKTEYYRLNFDLDFKERCELVSPYIFKHQEITKYLISVITTSLNYIIKNPDIKYIHAIKNIGYGVHLYWPNIILNKELHLQIYNLTIKLIEQDQTNNIPINIIKKIFDVSVCKSNGLRLFYNKINESFYYPSKELSTIEFSPDAKKHFKYCLLNTNYNNYNFTLHPDYIEALRLEKELKSEKDFDNYTDKYIESEINKELFFDLVNVLNPNRWDNYCEWLDLIFLFRTYNYKEELIKYSRQSNKFDNKSLIVINKIFNKPIVEYKKKTIGSLIYWTKQDNYKQTVDILYKYNI